MAEIRAMEHPTLKVRICTCIILSFVRWCFWTVQNMLVYLRRNCKTCW